MRQHHLRRRMPVSPLSTALSPLGTTSSDNSEETPADHSILSTEERTVVRHFESNHSRSKEGRFVVLLPRNPSAKQIGESRSQAVRRFLSLERVRRFVSLEPSLTAKGRFKELDDVMQKYLDLGHAEQIGESRSQAVRRFVSLEPSLTAKGRFKELDDVMQKYLDLGHAEQIGESRSQAVRRFLSLERSLTAKGRFKELDDVMQEYLDLGHAEPISSTDLERPIEDVQGYKHYHTSQSSVQQNRLLEYP
jgi:negative regulator of replication initiation